MMATLLSLAGYLLYTLCMSPLSVVVFRALKAAFPSLEDLPDFIQLWIALIILFTVKNFQWVVFISESHFTLPSTLFQVIDILVCHACYQLIVCIIMGLVLGALLGTAAVGELPDWVSDIMIGVTFVVTDSVTSDFDPALISEFLSSTLRFLNFLLLDMFVKPSIFSDTVTALVGLSEMIATTLWALFLVVALSFLVLMFLYMCVQILAPSAWHDYPVQTFASIFGLTFVGMKIMLDIPVGPSIFSDMRVGLLGIINMVNSYRSVYMVIELFTVVAIPLLSMKLRGTISMCNLYTITAFMVAIGLMLAMPITENSAPTLITDDYVKEAITSLVTSQIKNMNGGIELLTDS